MKGVTFLSSLFGFVQVSKRRYINLPMRSDMNHECSDNDERHSLNTNKIRLSPLELKSRDLPRYIWVDQALYKRRFLANHGTEPKNNL